MLINSFVTSQSFLPMPIPMPLHRFGAVFQTPFMNSMINPGCGFPQCCPQFGGGHRQSNCGVGNFLGGSQRGGGRHLDGYIRGLQDSLKQVKGPQSEAAGDNARVKNLLNQALQKRSGAAGAQGSMASCPPGRQAMGGHTVNININIGCSGGPQRPQCSHSGGAQRGGGFAAGYREGVQAALGVVTMKPSAPDRKRIQGLLNKVPGC